MSGNILLVLCLLVALVESGEASLNGEASADEEMKETNVLQQLLGRQERLRDLVSRKKMVAGRTARRVEDNREMMTKQIMHAISEMVNSECTSDRDYQGWVDFGRRDAE